MKQKAKYANLVGSMILVAMLGITAGTCALVVRCDNTATARHWKQCKKNAAIRARIELDCPVVKIETAGRRILAAGCVRAATYYCDRETPLREHSP
jgi:hypothetical protein